MFLNSIRLKIIGSRVVTCGIVWEVAFFSKYIFWEVVQKYFLCIRLLPMRCWGQMLIHVYIYIQICMFLFLILCRRMKANLYWAIKFELVYFTNGQTLHVINKYLHMLILGWYKCIHISECVYVIYMCFSQTVGTATWPCRTIVCMYASKYIHICWQHNTTKWLQDNKFAVTCDNYQRTTTTGTTITTLRLKVKIVKVRKRRNVLFPLNIVAIVAIVARILGGWQEYLFRASSVPASVLLLLLFYFMYIFAPY